MKTKGSKMAGGNIIKSIAICFLLWLGIIFCGALITAYLVYAKIGTKEIANYSVVLIHLASSATASALIMSKIKEKNILCAALCAVGIVGVLMLSNFLFWGDGINGLPATALIVFAGCLCPVLIGGRTKNKVKIKMLKY